MSRFALLIESSVLTSHTDLPGARADVRLLRRWLISPKGGAWFDHEIVTLSHPTVNEVQEQLEKARTCHYFFGAFSGHGHHVVTKAGGQTRVCLNDYEEMPARSLSPGNERATVVIDACRGLTVVLPRLVENRMAKALKFSMRDDRAAARRTFERLIASCDSGTHYLYSCSIGQSAAEDEEGQGGLFTLGLVRAAQRWIPRAGRYYSVRNAFDSAATFTVRENPQQNPRCIPRNLNRYFPFAIPH